MTYIYRLILTGFILFSGVISAAETEDVTIAQLIKEVKQSKDDARRQAMNRLKLKLRSLNEETRQQVMLQLRQSFASGQGTRFSSHTMTQQPIQKSTAQPQTSATQTQAAPRQVVPRQSVPKQSIPQQPTQNRPSVFPRHIPPNGGHP